MKLNQNVIYQSHLEYPYAYFNNLAHPSKHSENSLKSLAWGMTMVRGDFLGAGNSRNRFENLKFTLTPMKSLFHSHNNTPQSIPLPTRYQGSHFWFGPGVAFSAIPVSMAAVFTLWNRSYMAGAIPDVLLILSHLIFVRIFGLFMQNTQNCSPLV